MGGLVSETFELCLKVVVMETWGVAGTLYCMGCAPPPTVGWVNR